MGSGEKGRWSVAEVTKGVVVLLLGKEVMGGRKGKV